MTSPKANDVPAPRPPLSILLAAPRGFCAGVDRAIQIVELALARFGAPVYVRHEIVHNRFVVDSLRSKGAIFVEELSEIPDTKQPVIFSAHGVATAVRDEGATRNLFILDATCPLVFKVHSEAERHHAQGLDILLIGHAGHQEVIGTMGQLPPGTVQLVETVADALLCDAARPGEARLRDADNALGGRHPGNRRRPQGAVPEHRRPGQRGYLLRNDQPAVGGEGDRAADRLPDRGRRAQQLQLAAPRRGGPAVGLPRAFLIQRASEIDWLQIGDIRRIGITAGASAPDILVNEVVDAFRARYEVAIETVTTAEERIAFNVPRELRNPVTTS